MKSGVKCRQYRYALLSTLYTCKRGATLSLLTPLKVKIVIACIRHLFVLIQPDKVDIEIIHKKLLTVIGSAERPFGYWTALVHKRFRF